MTTKLDPKKFEPAAGTNSLLFGLVAVGVVTFGLGLFVDAHRVWYAYLVYYCLFLGLGVGSMFFLAVHYLSSAGWNVAVRRVTESFASYLFMAAAFSVVLFFGLTKIYPWTDLAFMERDHVLVGKTGYFGTAFFVARVLVFFAMMCFFAWRLLRNSTAQDSEGGVELLNRQRPLSALFLVLFAPLFTMFSVDIIKSLDPKWFSTMWGIYIFSGFVQSSIAGVIVAITKLKKHGYLNEVTADHFHDLGKYLFGFTIFWAYIAVSQYLLIWYANLPEETSFYLARQNPGWVIATIIMPTMRFALPFLLLLPREAKRNSAYLVKIAYLVLFSAWLDLYWIIMPNLTKESFSFSLWDVGIALGFFGAFALVVRSFLAKHSMVPVKDPFLHETLHHHVM